MLSLRINLSADLLCDCFTAVNAHTDVSLWRLEYILVAAVCYYGSDPCLRDYLGCFQSIYTLLIFEFKVVEVILVLLWLLMVVKCTLYD